MKPANKLLSILLVLTLLFALSVPAAAADGATASTMRLEETEGTVTVKTSSGQTKSVIKGMRLYNGYVIETGKSSSAYVSLDDTKAVKLDSSGKIEIKKSGKQLEVSLLSGQLVYNLTEPLAANETFSIRTATCITGIRGSFGWANEYSTNLMHGHVNVTVLAPDGSELTLPLTSGQSITRVAELSEGGALFAQAPITPEMVPASMVRMVMENPDMQQQLAADTDLDVQGLIDSLPVKEAQEAAQEEAAAQQAEAALAEQDAAVAAEGEPEPAAADVNDTPTYTYFEIIQPVRPVTQPTQPTTGGDAGSTTPTTGGDDQTAEPTNPTTGGGDADPQDPSDEPHTVTLDDLVSGDSGTISLSELLSSLAKSTSLVILPASVLNDGSMDDNAGMNLTNPDGMTLTLSNDGDEAVEVTLSALTNNGTVVVEEGVTLILVGGSNNNGTITNNGTIQLGSTAGTTEKTGTLSNGNDATITNNDTIEITTGSTITNNGTITNKALITDEEGVSTPSDAAINNNGMITNNGTITNEGATYTDENGDDHTATATINNNGTITGSGTYSGDGTIRGTDWRTDGG